MIKKFIKKMDPELTGNGIGAIIGSTIPGISGALAGVIGGKAVEKFINRYKADNVTSNFNPSNEFKKVKFDISQTLKEIIEIDIYGEYNFTLTPPESKIQYWECRLSMLDNDSKIITVNCGYFWSKEISKQNIHLDINKFFSINDCLADEFFCTCDINSNLDKLYAHLLKLEEIYRDFSISIDIEGFINSDSSWLKIVCEELILILHLDENFPKKVIPLCMQSERYLYKSSSTNNQVSILKIPFNKINYFSNYKKA